MLWRSYIKKAFTLIEVVIAFLVIGFLLAFLLATTVPGFLRARKRSQALKIPSELRTTDPALDPIVTSRATGSGLRILTGPNS
jgi:prepilin-type N-terminal cleavage/methylation domain-containing protein